MLIYIFSSFLIVFKSYSRIFNEDILRLVFTFIVFVGFAVISGSVATSGSVACSGVGSRNRTLYKFFIGNNLLLKLLRTFLLH